MDTIKFKANISTASKKTKDKYYMIGLSRDKYDMSKYIIFQKPYDLNKDEDPDAEQNGVFCEANGDQCYNKVEYVKISSDTFEAVVYGTKFIVDISNANVRKKFIEYAEFIFGEKLTLIE